MLKITQVKSPIGRPPKQRGTLRALGLKRINHTVLKDDSPEIRGMAAVVHHLVTVEVLEEPGKKGARKARAGSAEKKIEGEA
jgi:large subunit ribosomal protein L30